MVEPDYINPCAEIELGEHELCNLREYSFLDYFIDQVDADDAE